MIGVKCSGKTRIETHTFISTLTPKPTPTDENAQESRKFVLINRHLNNPAETPSQDIKPKKQESPNVKDGSAFPLMVGGSPDNVDQKPKVAAAWEREVDVRDKASLPSLGSPAAKPISKRLGPSTQHFAS